MTLVSWGSLKYASGGGGVGGGGGGGWASLLSPEGELNHRHFDPRGGGQIQELQAAGEGERRTFKNERGGKKSLNITRRRREERTL